jgi:hypothetical protein
MSHMHRSCEVIYSHTCRQCKIRRRHHKCARLWSGMALTRRTRNTQRWNVSRLVSTLTFSSSDEDQRTITRDRVNSRKTANLCSSSVSTAMILLISSLLLLGLLGSSNAHVRLTYPPARPYAMDFLDNIRTEAPCGMPKTLREYNVHASPTYRWPYSLQSWGRFHPGILEYLGFQLEIWTHMCL